MRLGGNGKVRRKRHWHGAQPKGLVQPTGLVQPKGFVQPRAASSYCRCVVASALLSLVAAVLHLGGCRCPVRPCVLTGRPCCCSTIALAIVGGGVPVLLFNLLALSGFLGIAGRL